MTNKGAWGFTVNAVFALATKVIFQYRFNKHLKSKMYKYFDILLMLPLLSLLWTGQNILELCYRMTI